MFKVFRTLSSRIVNVNMSLVVVLLFSRLFTLALKLQLIALIMQMMLTALAVPMTVCMWIRIRM